MKRALLTNVIVLVSLLSLSCSRTTSFLVINSSDSSLEIEYVITDKTPIEQTWSKPLKMSLANWNKWFGKKEWLEIPRDEYSFDAAARKCRLILPAGEILNFNRELESFDDDYKYFKVEYLKLNGSKGEMIFEGKDFYKRFEKDNLSYFVDYK